MASGTRSSIEVAIRVRPLRPEIRETKEAWTFTSTTARELANPDVFFTFDHIYSRSATTQQLYERSVRDSIVRHVALGYNGTVFAYGQTGSGKTYTMFGDGSRHDTDSVSLIELAVRDLFAALERAVAAGDGAGSAHGERATPAAPSTRTGRRRAYQVHVSALEIYNEQLRDLLLPEGQPARPLSIRESEHGVYVHHALRAPVSTAAQCLRTIYTHVGSRVSAMTAMNDASSRSHCIIQLHVETTVDLSGSDSDDEASADTGAGGEDERDTASTASHATDSGSLAGRARARGRRGTATSGRGQKKIVSVLSLVDLAGSERVSKSNAVGVRMVEGGHINKSLTALTTVINRLLEIHRGSGGGGGPASAGVPSINTFVPYRDSRLTHLLKTSVGGNAFTCVLCCVTPALESVDESRSTLQFASRAKKIRNRVCVNELVSSATRVRELEVELRRVRRQLVAQTIYLWSKQLTIEKLQARLRALVVDDGDGDGLHDGDGARAAAVRRRAGPEQQRALILEQLQARNEALERELAQWRGTDRTGYPSQGPNGRDETATTAAATAAAELDAARRELERETKAQALELRQLRERCREAEGLLDDLDSERAAAVAEAELVRTQLHTTQAKLLERSRSDAQLEELAQLHVAHQELQIRHRQQTDLAQRRARELQARLTEAQHRAEDVEDELEESRDAGRQLQAYLWRFLALASLASTGHVDPELTTRAGGATERPPSEKQVATAMDSLTRLVGASHTADGGSGTDSGSGGGGTRELAALRARVRELEAELLCKDAQRDVLVDTKLKRMQDLVLRLHAMNGALTREVRQYHADNEELFRISQRYPKIASKLSAAGLFPRSLQSALERAWYAEPAEKPAGHN